MPARVAIRRLNLRGLAPRDHPAPGELQQRLIDAAQEFLPDAIEQAVQQWSGDAVLRIRRLEVDITLDAAFEPQSFAPVLARAIVRELHRAEQAGSSNGDGGGVVCYASRAIYLAALLEALAEGRAAERWWLRDAEGLRFLTAAQAIRTAVVADVRVGLEALASLPPLRRMAVLRVLTPVEAERILKEFAGEGGGTSLAECEEAVRRAARQLPDGASALAIYVEAFAGRPALAGETLAAAAHAAERSRPPQTAPLYRFTPFGGLLMLLPDLGVPDVAVAASACPAAPPDAAALVAYAALGLCAGRDRLAAYLSDGLWRELFGLDPGASAFAIADRLCAFDDDMWSALAPLAVPLDRLRDARFLLAPRGLVASRGAVRALAGLARAAIKRFARRLPGFSEASAPFLWASVLATSAALERRPGGWSAQLSRAPLDVLVSLARAAEGSVQAPSGGRINLSRTPA